MIEKDIVTRTTETSTYLICDCCGLKVSLIDGVAGPEDWMNQQEFVSFRKTGGYGSIFGDGTKVALDLCETCFWKLVGKHCKLTGVE